MAGACEFKSGCNQRDVQVNYRLELYFKVEFYCG